MGQADRIDAHFAHGGNVFGNVLFADRPALAIAVLMIADAAQDIGFAVEKEPLVGSNRIVRMPKFWSTLSVTLPSAPITSARKV
jgi:hypothetical protein